MSPITAMLFSELGTVGRCLCCDGPLPKKRHGEPGRRKTVLCGDVDCERTYHTMHDAKVRELAKAQLQGMGLTLRFASTAIRRANTRLAAAEGGSR